MLDIQYSCLPFIFGLAKI